jgi:hypothetical protein
MSPFCSKWLQAFCLLALRPFSPFFAEFSVGEKLGKMRMKPSKHAGFGLLTPILFMSEI